MKLLAVAEVQRTIANMPDRFGRCARVPDAARVESLAAMGGSGYRIDGGAAHG